MARPRLPTAIHETKGSFTKNPQRRRPNEPKPTGDLGPPPAHLNEKQAECWKELAETAAPRVLTNSDRWMVEVAARLMAELRLSGDLAATKLALLTNCLGRMGMTPAERSKVAVPPAEQPASPWAAFTAIPGGKAD